MKGHCLILYDGYCNLCSRTVQWIIRNDSRARFSFLPLQEAKQEYEKVEGDTVLLLKDDKEYQRSTAVLMIAVRLRFPWPLLGVFFVVPGFIRDAVYRLVAKNRRQWFGSRSTCFIPDKTD